MKSNLLAATALLLLLVPGLVRAQTAPPASTGPAAVAEDVNPTGWTSKVGLSFVESGGNSEASTFGLKFGVSYNWTKTYFSLVGSGVRSSSTVKDTFAVGSPSDFEIVENKNTETTAENYLLDASLDHNITKRFYWGGGAGWRRNTFAGIDSRIAARAGAGYVWTDSASKGAQFKTGLFLTLTHQSLVNEDPGVDDTFVGVRFLADLGVPIGKSSKFASIMSLDENLQTTDDFRMTSWNSLSVSMNSRLAIQVSLLAYYDNLPALQAVPVYRTPLPVGPPLGEVLVPYGKWDTELSVSLVINIAPKKPAPAPAPAGGK
jgi:putative salt-induced outer membrane protein YdiY